MNWTNWLTLGIAVLGAVTGTYSVVRQHLKDRPRLHVAGFIQQGDDGRRRLRIKLVNTGYVPVTVEKVFLTGGRSKPAKTWELWEHDMRYAKLPKLLQPGEQVIVVTHLDAVATPVMDEAYTVVAKTADGLNIKASGANRAELAMKLKTLAWEAEDPAKR